MSDVTSSGAATTTATEGGATMVIRTTSAAEVFRLRQAAASSRLQVPPLIDVRTPAEFAQLHAEGARPMPLNQLDAAVVAATRSSAGETCPIFVICKSGARAAKAIERLNAAGIDDLVNVEGGTDAWVKAGLPIVRGSGGVISIERQVRMIAGLVVLLGVGLGAFVHPAFLLLAAFMGAGLAFAGATDWCGLGLLLTRMPWNRGDFAPSTSTSAAGGNGTSCESQAAKA